MASNSLEDRLIESIARFRNDPLAFVLFAYDWGHGELKDYLQGPDDWQVEILKDIGDQLRQSAGAKDGIRPVIRIADSAGNGVGKSALLAWLIDWAMSTRPDTRINITAETENQLRTKTWPELHKWHLKCICAHWFELEATSMYSRQKGHEKLWRTDMMPWSATNPEAFSGLHNAGKTLILLFDESSAIADDIFRHAEGAWTDKDTDIICIMFGNPTRNTGYFFDAFHKMSHRWHCYHTDSRKVRITNKAQIQQWVDDYGEDSDWVRVHVQGLFPNTSSLQFIPSHLVEAARSRHIHEFEYNFAPVIIGVDPAWGGGAETVIFLRQGNMSKMLAAFRNQDDVYTAGLIAQWEDEYKADAVFIDLGYGTGIFSAGKNMGRSWTLVSFGGKSGNPGMLNKKAEMWDSTRTWLKEGGCIPNDPKLCDQLTGPEYRVKLNGQVMVEGKDEMEKRGLESPDRAEGLALTFAFPVRGKEQNTRKGNRTKAEDYDALAGV